MSVQSGSSPQRRRSGSRRTIYRLAPTARGLPQPKTGSGRLGAIGVVGEAPPPVGRNHRSSLNSSWRRRSFGAFDQEGIHKARCQEAMTTSTGPFLDRTNCAGRMGMPHDRCVSFLVAEGCCIAVHLPPVHKRTAWRFLPHLDVISRTVKVKPGLRRIEHRVAFVASSDHSSQELQCARILSARH